MSLTNLESVKCIAKTLEPILLEMQKKTENESLNAINERICQFVSRIFTYALDCNGGHSINGVEIMHVELTLLSNLADLQAVLLFDEETGRKESKALFPPMVKFLDLAPSLEKIEPSFPAKERISRAAKQILQKVSLYEFQRLRVDSAPMYSNVWYALATDEEFAARQINDLEKINTRANVLALRLNDMEKRNPALLKTCSQKPFSIPEGYDEWDLTIGQLRSLSGDEINRIASRLPPAACAMLSNSQMQKLDFTLLTSHQLQTMAENITDGLEDLLPSQISLLIDNSFTEIFNFSEEFYKKINLTDYTGPQIQRIFCMNPAYKKNAVQHLHSVPPDRIAKGLHLLSNEQLEQLSDEQIKALPYSTMSAQQIHDIFLGTTHPLQEKRRRINLIPLEQVNAVIAKRKNIFCLLSSKQQAKVDCTLFEADYIASMFPPISLEHLYPGFQYKQVEKNGITKHIYTAQLPVIWQNSELTFTSEKIHTEIELHKYLCKENAKRFTKEQLLQIKPKLSPAICSLLGLQ